MPTPPKRPRRRLDGVVKPTAPPAAPPEPAATGPPVPGVPETVVRTPLTTSVFFRPRCTELPRSLSALVEMQSTIVPLAGPVRPLNLTNAAHRVFMAVAKYRERLNALLDAQLIPAVPDAKRTYLLNCPPPCFPVIPHMQRCGRTQFCPFCHARYAAHVFDVIDRVCFPRDWDATSGGELQTMVRECTEFDLVERTSVIDNAVYDTPHPGRTRLLEEVLWSRSAGKRARQRAMQIMGAVGMAEFIHVGVVPKSNRPKVRFQQLLLLPHNSHVIRDEDPLLKCSYIRRHQLFNRNLLAWAVSRMMRYPTYLITGVDLEQAAKLWQSRSIVRCTALLGNLRGAARK